MPSVYVHSVRVRRECQKPTVKTCFHKEMIGLFLCGAVVASNFLNTMTTYKLYQRIDHYYLYDNWNDRRLRRVFLRFYSAISQLMSVKFQIFAYNSRTIRSSYMKFWQQFEINELYVCIKVRGNKSCKFGCRTRKLPHKFGIKIGLSQKRLKYGKKYFIWLYVLRYPFIPTNPLWPRCSFFFFFLPNFCTPFFSWSTKHGNLIFV